MNSFFADLEIGINMEEEVLAYIRQKYPLAIREVAKKEHDLLIPEIGQTVEVKQDFKSKHTGNFVIEVEMYGRPSGLLSSTADWWCFCDGDSFLFVEREKIHSVLNGYTLREFIGKGDNEPKKAYLVPKEHLTKIGTICIPPKK